jgi:hypothetical protein
MPTRRRFVFAVLTAQIAWTGALAHAQVTTLVSKSTQGEISNAHCDSVDVSADGRWIVFESAATNLVPPDTNNRRDVFLHDALEGVTTRVSIGYGGVETDHDSYQPTISADGRYIAFVSGATNILSVPVPGYAHIYLVERESGAIERIDVNDAGETADSFSSYPALDSTGRWVAFSSAATNLAPSVSVGIVRELYVRDRVAGTTTLLSVDPSGSPSGASFDTIDMSWDGGTIVCATFADDLGPVDTNGVFDVYAYGLHSGVWSLVSVSSTGAQGFHPSLRPSVSADGRWVAFESWASTLHPDDATATLDVFVRDLAAGTTELVSYAKGGTTLVGDSRFAEISSDGRFVYFASSVALSPLYSTGGGFRRDRLTGALEAVSLGHELQMGPVDQRMATTSDGAIVVFASWTMGLTPEDTTPMKDVFYRAASGCPPGTYLYPDADGDGYGVPAVPILSCSLVEGFAGNTTDCDDTDPSIHPGAAEPCNGVDEDCDLAADDGCVVVYCQAKPNSLGCLPTIAGSATFASAAGPDHFFVQSAQTLSGQFGVLLLSQTPGGQPFGGGLLCLGFPMLRVGAQNSGGSPPGIDCSGQFSFHLSQSFMLQIHLQAGDTVYGQYWSRDPGFSAPNHIGLTAGLEVTIGP